MTAALNDKLLIEHGCKVRSSVVVMEKAFITVEAWVTMTPKVFKGYRSLPFIKANSQWWVLEILDGFGAHLSRLDASQQ